MKATSFLAIVLGPSLLVLGACSGDTPTDQNASPEKATPTPKISSILEPTWTAIPITTLITTKLAVTNTAQPPTYTPEPSQTPVAAVENHLEGYFVSELCPENSIDGLPTFEALRFYTDGIVLGMTRMVPERNFILINKNPAEWGDLVNWSSLLADLDRDREAQRYYDGPYILTQDGHITLSMTQPELEHADGTIQPPITIKYVGEYKENRIILNTCGGIFTQVTLDR